MARKKDPETGISQEMKRESIRMIANLQAKVDVHFARYQKLCPELKRCNIVRSGAPEKQELWLPSSFESHAAIEAMQMTDLANVEGKLRIGQAHEALRDLRETLGLKDGLAKVFKAHVRGYSAVTRSEGELHRVAKRTERQRGDYDRAYRALVSLGVTMGAKTEAGILQALLPSHLVPLSEYTDAGKWQKKAMSWIWRIVRLNDEDELSETSEWATEGEARRPVAAHDPDAATPTH